MLNDTDEYVDAATAAKMLSLTTATITMRVDLLTQKKLMLCG